MKLFVPNLGTLMILEEDWTFPLYSESRNRGLMETILKPYIKPSFIAEHKYWFWSLDYLVDRDHRSWRTSNESYEPEQMFINDEMPEILKIEKAMTKSQLDEAYASFKATNAKDNLYVEVTLPKGTQLKVDRIYIRQGSESFSSITFRTTKVCPIKEYASKRFWVKLRDANQMNVLVVG